MSDVLAVAESRDGSIRAVSLELIAAAEEIASDLGGAVHVALIGPDASSLAAELNVGGVATIHVLDHDAPFSHDAHRQAINQLAESLDPRVVLTPQSVNGMDYAPAIATDLDGSLVTDVIEYNGSSGDGMAITREMYGSKVETTVAVSGDPIVATVREGEWEAPTQSGDAEVVDADVTLDEGAFGSTVTGFEELAGGDVDISEAEVLVSVGRGIEEEENLEIIHELADAMGATVSASRPIVDAGWLPKNRQVGQSGKTVTPDLYLAIGISGAVQHVAGMKGADTIVAINNDPNAPIFDIADYGIVDDLFDVVPALTEALA